MEPDHPLLPIALDSLKQKMSVRPSADDLCERLAALKFEVKYAQSVERCTEQSVSLATLQLQIQEKEDKMEDIRQQLREKSIAVDRIKEECAKELSTKDLEMKRVIHDCQAALRAKTTECEKNYILIEQLRKEKQDQPTSEQKAAFSKWKAMVSEILYRAVTTMRHLRQLPPRSNQEVQCSVQTLFWPQSHALTFYFT